MYNSIKNIERYTPALQNELEGTPLPMFYNIYTELKIICCLMLGKLICIFFGTWYLF